VNGPWKYLFNGELKGPFIQCTDFNPFPNEGGGRSWCMLPAFNDCNAQEGWSWKYTEDEDDPECMTDWVAISCDGIKTGPFGRTTVRNGRRWCALPTYISGPNKANVLWEWC
jgi:hypothetical protein